MSIQGDDFSYTRSFLERAMASLESLRESVSEHATHLKVSDLERQQIRKDLREIEATVSVISELMPRLRAMQRSVEEAERKRKNLVWQALAAIVVAIATAAGTYIWSQMVP